MQLLKYLAPMKNIPERFSNLAFWRGLRKLKDEVIHAFEYVDEWGTEVENSLSGFKLVQSMIVKDTDEINEMIVELSNYKYRILYVFIKLPAGSYDRCIILFTFEGDQVYQYTPYIGAKNEDYCLYALVGYDGDAPIALETDRDTIRYSPQWLKNFKSGSKLAQSVSIAITNHANFPAGMEIYIYGKEYAI